MQPASSGKSCRSDRRNALEQAAEVALSSHCSPAAEGGWNQAVLKVRRKEGMGPYALTSDHFEACLEAVGVS